MTKKETGGNEFNLIMVQFTYINHTQIAVKYIPNIIGNQQTVYLQLFAENVLVLVDL